LFDNSVVTYNLLGHMRERPAGMLGGNAHRRQ
jgi:hypothetical protein